MYLIHWEAWYYTILRSCNCSWGRVRLSALSGSGRWVRGEGSWHAFGRFFGLGLGKGDHNLGFRVLGFRVQGLV